MNQGQPDSYHCQKSLMFIDLVGYSRLMERNEEQAIVLLEKYQNIAVRKIEKYNGSVVEFVGDAVFACFDQASEAVPAACEIQTALAKEDVKFLHHSTSIQARIGLHSGEVRLKDGGVFGDSVNIAARLEPISVPGGICLSYAMLKLLPEPIPQPLLDLGKKKLKNIVDSVGVILVRPSGIDWRIRLFYQKYRISQFLNSKPYFSMAMVTALFFLVLIFLPLSSEKRHLANYLEVSDFKNINTQGGGVNYFSAGISAAVRSQLGTIPNMLIVDGSKGVRGDLRLEGTVQKYQNQIRLSYTLIRNKDNVQIAAGQLDGSYNDIFVFQDRVAADIAGHIYNEFSLTSDRPAALKMTENIEAYDYYLQGLEKLKISKTHDNLDDAIQSFSSALLHDSKFALANSGLCQAYLEKYKFTQVSQWASKAQEYCQLAFKQDDSLLRVYITLATLYTETGRFESALESLTKVFAVEPYNVEAKLSFANVLRLQNKGKAAEAMLRDLLLDHSRNWHVYMQLSSLLMHTGRIEEAISVYQQALKFSPENSMIYSNLGGAYLYVGDFEEAANAFAESVRIAPSSWGYSNSGTLYYHAGNYHKAAAMFRNAIRLAPEDFRWRVNLADTIRQIPEQEADAEQYYLQGIKLAQAGLQVNDSDPGTHMYLATSYLFTGQFSLAKEHLEKAKKLSPDDANTLYIELKYWEVLNKPERALAVLKKLLATGYAAQLLDNDPDLSRLRADVRFQTILTATE